MSDPVGRPRPVVRSWPLALAVGVGVVAAGLLLVAYVPNYLVGHLTSLSRGARGNVAAAVSTLAVIAMAVVLRRLQRRGVI